MTTFSSLFTYEDEYAFDEGIHCFHGCKMLKTIYEKDGKTIVVGQDDEVDDVLFNMLKGVLKLHIGDKIVVADVDMGASVRCIKEDTDPDSDFELSEESSDAEEEECDDEDEEDDDDSDDDSDDS